MFQNLGLQIGITAKLNLEISRKEISLTEDREGNE
uniref:Uncharacterized protein n=1 Tax=Medicago truncatula TaxID=3880 RepID=B7FGF0_MEDTR|nr:unknown [Medicago truncatula]